MDGEAGEEGVYEVEDLLEWQNIDGKDHYLVKWKGYNETSWEPDENIGQELAELKASARRKPGGDGKRRRDKDKKDKKDKKEKKKRRRDRSASSKRSASDSSDDEQMPPGMPGFPPGMMPPGMHGMPGMPGMPPGMPPGMMHPGFPPDMPPGMMHGMMPPGMFPPGMDPTGKGKGMGPPGMHPPHMMMKGKGPPMGKGMPPPWDPWGKGLPPPPGKGMPHMGKGMKGPPPFGKPGPPMGPGQHREALDTQRFALDKKRKLREFVGALHAHLKKEDTGVPEEKLQRTKEFQEAIGLQLEGHQLPVLASSELIVTDALWLLWLFDPHGRDEDAEILMQLAKLVKASSPKSRQYIGKLFRKIWPKPTDMPSGGAVKLFSLLSGMLPKVQPSKPGQLNGMAPPPGMHGEMNFEHPPGFWREVITALYWEHNPSKLNDVDALLTKYQGREKTLYLGICEKYKVPPKPEVVMPGMMPPGMPGWSGGEKPTDPEFVKKIRELICEVYREHNPSKLEEVDNLLKKYEGREEQVYRSICDKYKVEPKLPKEGEKEDKKDPVQKYKDLITEVYEQHNKEKLGEIDDILKKYEGKEKTLYLAICTKYNIEPKTSSKKKKKEKGPDEKAHEEAVAKIKPLICEVYQAHNPAKLDDVDKLLAKYKGREELLYHSVCDKYNVTPTKVEPPAPPPPPADPTKDSKMDVDAGEKKDEKDGEAATDGAEKKEGEQTGEKPADNEKPAEGEAPAPAKTLRETYAELIREVYTEHNPAKLDGMDRLLDKYLGQEHDLYVTICKKYDVKAKDPEGLGDLEWMETGEDHFSRLLEGLVSAVVLHETGLRAEDAKGLTAWEEVRRKPAPRNLSQRFELSGFAAAQVEQLARELHGDEDVRWRRLQERCEGADVKVPSNSAGGVQKRAMSVTCNGGGPKGRRPFDDAVMNLTDALARAVRDCIDFGEEGARFHNWMLPWSGEEVVFIMEDGAKREVGVEYRRGCWTLKRRPPLHANSINHSLCGPDVEARLPQMWRELADRLWLGITSLKWGVDMPVDAVIVVEAFAGHAAQPAGEGMHSPCTAARPGISVVVTAPAADDLERAKMAIGPVLQKVLSELQMNALFAPSSLCMPQLRGSRMGASATLGMLPGKGADAKRRRGSGASSSSSSSSDEMEDVESEEVMSDAEPSENYRPLRLTREKIRDAYLQGLLCLNCDAADHKHQECPFKRKVCWNCHGNHAGKVCPHRCRFTKDRHDYPLLESIKRVCRRVNDWKKSKAAQEQRAVLASLEQLMIKLEGFEDLDLAKHNREVQKMVKDLAEMHALFPGEVDDLARSILDMKPAPRKPTEFTIPPPPPGVPPKPYVAPKLPKESPPAMPENKYPWSEKIFLDNLLTRGMYGSNILSRIIGRGGMHHRRMETESGARVFFRGLGVSGRDAELNDPIDCRLHISVKGEVPQQGRSVRRIIGDIVAELDNEILEKGEAGPRLDRPRDPDLHPFGFLMPKGGGPEGEGPLKFKFPEEDGQTLNDLLTWLKQAKLPLELDSDTQWRTTLQVTPAEPALPDDAPEEVEAVAAAFGRLVDDWHYPSPYWFEEQDLRPTGLWTTLTANEEDGDSNLPIALQQGQGVRLSAPAVSHFAALLDQAGLLLGISRAATEISLRRLRGVVRRQVEDEQLLLFLAYPWAWFSGSGIRLPFGKDRVHEMLVELGRVGGKPTESCPAPAFRGFSVEWLPLQEGAPRPGAAPALAAPMPPATPALQAPQFAPATQALAPPAAAPPAVQKDSGAPRGYCKCWLPESIFASGQDLKELITGPDGAHFVHVLKKYPNVELKVEGQPTMTVPPAHRLHVSMSSEDSELFESAAADVLDLVETVCDMVGEELGLTEDQVEGLIQSIRAEKYFEAHGLRTPLPPARPRGAEPAVATPAEPARPGEPQAPITPFQPQAPVVVPLAGRSATAKVATTHGDFEFVDEDMEAADPRAAAAAAAVAGGGDETEDDARTEASDCVSELTEDEAPKQGAFEDI